MVGSRPGSAASRPGSASSRPGSAASRGSRPGSAAGRRPGSGKKVADAAATVDEETMVMLMRHRLDFVTPDRKVRLKTSALIDAGDEMVAAGRKTSAAVSAVVNELEASTAGAQAEVFAWAEQIKEAVDRRASMLVDDITRVYNLKTTRLEQQIAAVEEMMAAFDKAIAKTREGLAMVDDGGKDTKLNAGVKKLEQAIQRYTAEPVSLDVCETTTLRLATDADALVDLISNDGAVAGLRTRVLKVEPTSIPGEGCEIEITGSDFGVDDTKIEIWAGPVRCDLLEVHQDSDGNSVARCIVPPGSGTDLPVDVRFCGERGWCADGTAVSYAQPRIESLDPPGGPIGTEIAIHGHHLGGPGAPPRVIIGGILCSHVEVVEATSVLRITVPDDLATGTVPIVVERGLQASTEQDEVPEPVSLFDVAVKLRFGFDQKLHGGGLDFDLPDESDEGQGLVYTVRKVDNLDPDYTTVLGTESFRRGIHTWEVNFDRIGNTRVGLARWPGLSLDCALHSKQLQGEAWFVDYDGMVKHNRRGVLTDLKQILPINEEFKSGDTIGFMLDLRDNARHQNEDDSENLALAPPGRGKLTIRYKGKSFLVASDLGGELWPVFNMDNINEQLSLDFVIDGEDGDGTAVIRRTLEVPTRSTCEALFRRVDGDNSGLVSLAEVTEVLHDFYPDIELSVIMRAFKAADRANSGKLNISSFRKLFEYLIFFNNVAHLFDRIDDSGDGVLSLAEFKIGAHLIEPSISDSEIEAEFRKMDEEDEEQGVVEFDDFCTWMAERVIGVPSRPPSAASGR